MAKKIKKFKLTEDEFRFKMIDFAEDCLDAVILTDTFLGPNTAARKMTLKRVTQLSRSSSANASYGINEVPLEYRKMYKKVLAYFGF